MSAEGIIEIDRLLSSKSAALAVISTRYGEVAKYEDDFYFLGGTQGIASPAYILVLDTLYTVFNEALSYEDEDAVIICKVLCVIATAELDPGGNRRLENSNWAVDTRTGRNDVYVLVCTDLEILNVMGVEQGGLSKEQYHDCIAILERYYNTGKFSVQE